MFGDPEGPLIYVLIVLLLLFSAFFAGCESAYAYCNRHRMKVMADDGSKRAKLVLRILEHSDSTIITTLIAINICHVVTSVLTTILAIYLIGAAGSIVATIVTTIVVFLFAEILPKNIAMLNADKWAMNASFILYFFKILFFPISIIFGLLLKVTKKTLNLDEDEDIFDEDDFSDVVEKVEEEGILDEEESDIIQAAIEFGDIKVKEVYTPRQKIVALDYDKCNKAYLKQFILSNTYSRIPVYKGSIDNIVGILHIRTYLKALFLNKNVNLKDILIAPHYVAPGAPIDEIFAGFSEHKTHIAIVRNAKGKTIGMVTMKDILEELVEDIDEESDEARLSQGGES